MKTAAQFISSLLLLSAVGLVSCTKMQVDSATTSEDIHGVGTKASSLTLNQMTDTDGSTYLGLFSESMVTGEEYVIDGVDLSDCWFDATYCTRTGSSSFKWTAPTGKYAIVAKPEYRLLYMFRIKGKGGDYEGWTPSAAGGTDKTGRNKRSLFMVGTGFGQCQKYMEDCDWALTNPATLNQNGRVDGTNQPLFLNLSTSDYTEENNEFTCITRFSPDKHVEFGFSGCANCVWPINFGQANNIVTDDSIKFKLSEKRDLGTFCITIPTIEVLEADYDSFYKITISNTRTGIDVIWANLKIEKLS